MAKYKSGECAMVGDVVECISKNFAFIKFGEAFTVNEVYGDFVRIAVGNYTAEVFKLIRRAQSPEPEQPKVNGVYASGEVPELGDEFEAIESYGAFYKIGDRFRIREFSQFGYIHADGLDGGFAAKRFKLISRKEQPAVKPEQSPPLVVWPQEKLTFHDLAMCELFVLSGGEPDRYVRQKVSEDSYVTLALRQLKPEPCIYDALPGQFVRRLKMTVAPQFQVI